MDGPPEAHARRFLALVLPGAADAALLGYRGDRRLAPSTTPRWPVWERGEVAASAGLLRARTQALFTLGASQPPAR